MDYNYKKLYDLWNELYMLMDMGLRVNFSVEEVGLSLTHETIVFDIHVEKFDLSLRNFENKFMEYNFSQDQMIQVIEISLVYVKYDLLPVFEYEEDDRFQNFATMMYEQKIAVDNS